MSDGQNCCHLVAGLLEFLKQVCVPLKGTGRHINSPGEKGKDIFKLLRKTNPLDQGFPNLTMTRIQVDFSQVPRDMGRATPFFFCTPFNNHILCLCVSTGIYKIIM